MPARTGEEYLRGLKEQAAEVYLSGERVKDVTTNQGTRNGAATIAKLLDMQHDPALKDEMTYTSPTSGQQVGLSFITPRTHDDLKRRRVMMTHWASATLSCRLTRSQRPLSRATRRERCSTVSRASSCWSSFEKGCPRKSSRSFWPETAPRHLRGGPGRCWSPAAARPRPPVCKPR